MFLVGWIAAALTLAFYLRLPSAMWNFDGVACAAALELGNPLYLFHSQHLLYGGLGFVFWRSLNTLIDLRALPALQLFSTLLGAAALYFLCRTLQAITRDWRLAVAMTMAAGLSAVYWTWSVEAQVYPLGALGLAGATYSLTKPGDDRRRALQTGLWHALAILGHVVHVLWAFPALYWMRRNGGMRRRYFLTVIASVLSAYAAVLALVALPYQGAAGWWMRWLKGSLGLGEGRALEWHWPGWSGPVQWIQATPGTWWGTFWPYDTHVPTWAWGVTLLSAAIAAFLLVVAVWKSFRNPLVRFAFLWTAAYAAFFATWEPGTLCYRMSDVIPHTLLLSLGLTAIPRPRVRRLLAVFWLAGLGFISLWTRARPMSDIQRNAAYQQTLQLARLTPEQSVYVTAGGLDWIYLLYFTGRSAWNGETLSLPEFQAKREQQKPVPPLYLHTALLKDPRVQTFLKERRWKRAFSELPYLEIA